jgi:hypothetical protein
VIFVSQLAKTAMLKSLQQSGVAPSHALRLSWVRDGAALKVALKVDQPKDSDYIIHHRDSPVLIVDRHTANALGDAAIDIHDGDKGAKLVFQRMCRSQQLS